MLNSHSIGTAAAPAVRTDVSATRASITAVRSPYAVGTANALGSSGETSPGIKNIRPLTRRHAYRGSGVSALFGGRSLMAGQTYHFAIRAKTRNATA